MYHQILHVGEESVPCVIEYSHDEEVDVFVIGKIAIINGPVVPVGIFETEAIEDMTHRLAKGHDRVLAELHSMYLEDRAADNDAFRAAYGG